MVSTFDKFYNLKIQGNIFHYAPNFLKDDENNEKERCGQLYIYDDAESLEKRMDDNNELDRIHVKKLTEIMNKNPYAAKYKNLYEITKNQEIPKYKLYFTIFLKMNVNTYNSPRTSECAALIVSDDGKIPEDFDLCVYPRNSKDEKKLTKLSHFSFHLDPMTFSIIFPSGDLGYNYIFKQNENSSKKLTALQYYSYRLSYRKNDNHPFNPILFCGRLTQQYIIQAYIVIESSRLLYLKNNQKKLRISSYKGLLDHVHNSAANISENYTEHQRVGNIYVLP